MTSLELTQKIAGILDSKKAKDIRAVNIRDLTIIADYFVICTGTSTTQVKALSDEVEFRLKEQLGLQPNRIEGYASSSWILMDYGNVVVHVFLEDTRAFYSLERLWTDGVTLTDEELRLPVSPADAERTEK